ncbi:DUF4174 domain-containing protein [Vibrio crassostreae]|uniref:DUF4174 domain-containing protein n=1 Tax=Vibrio crassostreae TaxID=246167 RepID=UPI002E179FE3|nr:DUF4174 domain-containing protein [Vibrio crassostreae]
MLHRQTREMCLSIKSTQSVLPVDQPFGSGVGTGLLKLMTISIILIMCMATNSALAYPAYSHSSPLPHRSVIYFAPTEDSVVKEFLNEVLINNCQLDERDVVIMVIAESGYTVPTWLEEEFNLEAVTNVYEIPKGSHTAVLIGKDGKEKHRWNGKTDWQKITNIIDEMPMRQQEMQRQSSRCSI